VGKMSNKDRAKQFLPFDSLKGLQDALRIKEYENERISKGEISEDIIEKISNNMINYEEGNEVLIKYFIDGYYKNIKGVPLIDSDKRIIKINEIIIDFDNIFDFELV